jgi:sensor histidine kinase YesM
MMIALPTILVILLTGYIFRMELVRKTTQQQVAALGQSAASLDSGMQEFAIIASSLIHDRSLMKKTLEYVSTLSADQRYLITVSMDDIFNKYFILTKHLGSFSVFFTENGPPYVCRNFNGINFKLDEIEKFLATGKTRPGFVVFADTITSGDERNSVNPDNPVVSLVVNPAPGPGNATGIRTLLVSFDMAEIAAFIEQKNISQTFLVGQSGLVIAARDRAMIGRPFKTIRAELGSRFVMMEHQLETPGWTIAEAVSVSSLTRTVDMLMWYVYASLFFAQIVKPLDTVIREMDAVSKGNFSAKVEPCDFMELNKLGDSFNLMVAEIDTLTSEIKKEQKERLKIEVEALRYQLNPHFLCNTLNSIRMMALMTKNDAIRNMTTALMNITEDNLSRDETVYSLEHEVRNLDSYVYIMQVRYGDTFEYYKDIDSSLLPLGVPAMILQPFVENAILHGLHGLARTGTITVAASRTEDKLKLEVRDNGFGMTSEIRAGLFAVRPSAEKGFTRIGVYNVRRRIILTYGTDYDVTVLSYPGEGTVVTLTLPILDVTKDIRALQSEGNGQ